MLLGRRGAWAREATFFVCVGFGACLELDGVGKVPRLLCRFGELWWLRCALWQLPPGNDCLQLKNPTCLALWERPGN